MTSSLPTDLILVLSHSAGKSRSMVVFIFIYCEFGSYHPSVIDIWGCFLWRDCIWFSIFGIWLTWCSIIPEYSRNRATRSGFWLCVIYNFNYVIRQSTIVCSMNLINQECSGNHAPRHWFQQSCDNNSWFSLLPPSMCGCYRDYIDQGYSGNLAPIPLFVWFVSMFVSYL